MAVVTTRRDGSKRSYQLELAIRDGALAQGADTYFYVKYRYPSDDALKARQEAAARAESARSAEADNTLALHEHYGPRNWRYSAQGAGAIEPQAVYDNGKVTTFAFTGNQEIPAIYIENSDGSESLVPKNVDGEIVIVHALAAKFILRRGSDALCVFNEAYSQAGIDPGTNTTSPSVRRIVKNTRPPATPAPKQ